MTEAVLANNDSSMGIIGEQVLYAVYKSLRRIGPSFPTVTPRYNIWKHGEIL